MVNLVMEVQVKSYRKLMNGDIDDDSLEIKLYGIKGHLTCCLYLLKMKENKEEKNPFYG